MGEEPSTNKHFRGATPFKVQVHFYIHLFEGKLDANSLDKLIQVDIGGHTPIPVGSKQSFGNLLFLLVFRFLNFQGCFEGLNEVFS
jgi:hypothetical protein